TLLHGTTAGPLLLAILAAATPAHAQPLAPPTVRFPLSTETRVISTFQEKIKVTVLAHGIQRPWSLLPLPDGDFLVGVRPTGQVRAIRKGTLDPTPVAGLPPMFLSRTTGMLDMVLHPKYAENHWVYFTYHKPLDNNTYTLALGRARYDGHGFTDFKELYAGNPNRGWGSRLTFGLACLISITVAGAARTPEVQATNSIAGKTLRLKDDGTIPADNPFV